MGIPGERWVGLLREHFLQNTRNLRRKFLGVENCRNDNKASVISERDDFSTCDTETI